ncbi:helix-turn-helix domain-containing protein [Streptomyces uncialis]|uniref:helix-turn-helix domain-containing protein n=1 Tax=Streptomyces uncialis TaxID=1048205 RepID=UPI003866A295|nr:helix-turn-helix transcriptional regulator [Streptomyces uncialis]
MAEQQEQRTDFADLVRQRRAELGISLRELEGRAVDPETGERAKFGWISKVENGKSTDAPTREILRALAVGLGLPILILQQAAAAQYLGLHSHEIWSTDRTTRLIAARLDEMSDEERRQLADIADAWARRRSQGAERSS